MKRINVSQVDALFADGSYPIEFLFFFAEGLPINRIRGALRSLSSPFWPAFGEYREGCVFSVPYLEEDVIDEISVQDEFDIEAHEDTGAEFITRFRLKETKRLFRLQILRFKNGAGLIPMMHHLAGDGYSYFYLLSVLASLSRPARLPFKTPFIKVISRPHHRRTSVRDFYLHGMDAEPLPLDADLNIETHKISKREVLAMIEEAGASHDLRISSNDVLTAEAVKRLVTLRPGHGEKDVVLTIPIDVRRWVGEYGKRFFGNGIMLHSLTLERENILGSSPIDTAVRIRRSMPSVSTESYAEYLGELEKTIDRREWSRLHAFDPDRGCLVTNLSKLPVSRLDFGTGAPNSIVPLTVEKNSAGILANHDDYVLRLVC